MFNVKKSYAKRINYCSNLCRIQELGFKTGVSPWNKGKIGLRGKKHWNWKGGVDKEHTRIKQTVQYNEWRKSVYKKFSWTCKNCLYRGKNIVAHHIKSFAEYPKLRFVVSNGIVLCRKCHQETHKPRRKNYYQKRVLKNYVNH